MKVKVLIQELQKYDPNLTVGVGHPPDLDNHYIDERSWFDPVFALQVKIKEDYINLKPDHFDDGRYVLELYK